MGIRYDIIVPLDVCVDLILTGNDMRPEFNQKEKLANDYFLEMGGSNCIFACQAAKLRLRTAGIGVVGADVFGDLVKNSLSQANVDISNLKVDASFKTALGVAICQDEDRAILTYLGTIAAHGIEDILYKLLPETRHLHIGSYYLMDGIRPHYPAIVQKAKELGITISIDTNWDPDETWNRGLWEILPNCDVLFPNENEAMKMTGSNDPHVAAKKLCEYVEIVALKRGANGASVYSRKGEFYTLPSPRIKYMDSIGAGDSFDAGFLYGYLNGKPLKKCLQYAIACGSMNARGRGGVATQLRLAELQALMG